MSEAAASAEFERSFLSLLSAARTRSGLAPCPPAPETVRSLASYFKLLEGWNKRMDLVAPAPSAVLIERHLIDCVIAGELLFASLSLPSGSEVLDVGSGAGLPGLVWAISFPQYRFTLCEPREKRSLFLREVKRVLGLDNVEVVCSRLEELAAGGGPFAVVTARALGDHELFFQTSASLLAAGGSVALFTGSEGISSASVAGLKPDGEHPYFLSTDSENRGRRLIRWLHPEQ